MELREWLPLVVSGVLGLAGIVAGLWGTLANLRAQERRDKRAAEERSEQADRDAEASRRAHLLDERRSAYAELIGAAFAWSGIIRERFRHDYLGDDASDAAADRMRDAAALAQLVGPPAVRESVQETLSVFNVADVDSWNYVSTRDRDAWRSFNDMNKAVTTLITTLNADLAPASSASVATSQD
ncbi:hypothetical protein ACFVSK_02345 [Cellulosimicrobium cellulans]|uniref:hypothetical protein n=1 Tax=Cellulosimicrobium cellulans TaxID=1710 RepID=UPI0036E68F9B